MEEVCSPGEVLVDGEISWTDETDNYQAGCTSKSEACARCYAEGMSWRLGNMHAAGRAELARYEGVTDASGKWTGKFAWSPEALVKAWTKIRRARKPRRTWLGSMTDLFDFHAPKEALDALAAEIKRGGPRAGGRVILLTKVPRRLLRWQEEHFPEGLPDWLEVGVTAESQKWLDARWRYLREVKAVHKFLSMEPLLGPVELPADVLAGVELVVVGGESTHGGALPRPMRIEWVRAIRDACLAARVLFHFKQWGSAVPITQVDLVRLPTATTPAFWVAPSGEIAEGPGHHKFYGPVRARDAGRLLDGREHLDLPRAA